MDQPTPAQNANAPLPAPTADAADTALTPESPAALHARNFPSAEEDAAAVTPPTSRYSGPESAYRLAFNDTEFLLREDLRPIRMQLELLKPELVQREQGIESTIVIFGSARILSRDAAEQLLATARAADDPDLIRVAEMKLAMSHHYEEARRFAAIVTTAAERLNRSIAIVTGGGPGVMEAGNRGAFEVGGRSIGLNVVLPHEQEPNPYITPELCFQFHYFALRKMHFLIRAIALVCFPGGFGTLDETFEALTLMQTGKIRKRPVLLFGREFWTKLVNFDLLIGTGLVAAKDMKLIHFVESAEEAWGVIERHYQLDAQAETAAGTAHVAPL